MTEADILKNLKESILNFDEDLAEKTAQEAISLNMDPLKAVEDGLV